MQCYLYVVNDVMYKCVTITQEKYMQTSSLNT